MMLCGTAWIVNPRLCLGAAPASPVKRRRMKPPKTLRCDEPPLASGPPEAVALDVWINTPSIREVAHTRTSRVRIVQATLDSVAGGCLCDRVAGRHCGLGPLGLAAGQVLPRDGSAA